MNTYDSHKMFYVLQKKWQLIHMHYYVDNHLHF
jgi:hypothetical protein